MKLAAYLAESAGGVGVLGAIVGGAGALAKNYKSNMDGEISTQDAIYDTAKEATGAGVATWISALAVGAVGGGLFVSITTAVIAAAGVKYAWDLGAGQVEETLGINKEEKPVTPSAPNLVPVEPQVSI